jgi:hypothetical protein
MYSMEWRRIIKHESVDRYEEYHNLFNGIELQAYDYNTVYLAINTQKAYTK